MRLRWTLQLAALGLAVALVAPPASADFDPRGRRRAAPQKPGPVPGGARRAPARQAPPDAGQSQTALIERYTKIVLAQPGAPFPLQRLAQLHRDKDGSLEALEKDFEARAAQAGPEQYAATIALAGIYKTEGRPDDAARTYERAIALKKDDPAALLALARLLQDRGELAGARARYEEALRLQKAGPDKEQTLRTLMTLALDAKDWAAAKASHRELVKAQPQSFFVRGELGRELYQRAEYERAAAELKELVAAAAGDNRALAPALKDLGKAQAKAHMHDEALATLRRALQAAGREAAVRGEIYETIAEIYRADQNLPVLIKQIEDERPTDFQRLALLGGLYEETGDGKKALEAYRKALLVNPRHIDLRLRMIRVLESQGELDEAIVAYEALIRAAPNDPRFVFEQCEALMQRGDRERALKLLTQLEARAQRDEESLTRLADFYARIGENERSLKVLTRLSALGTNDPGHLVDLGERHFQDGNTELAVQTWRRILTAVTPRARALAALGEVYLDHDMLPDALAALREAVQLEPQTAVYQKQLAAALERGKSYRDARQIWQGLASRAKASGDKMLAREARTRIVSLWGFERVLEAQVGPLTAQFEKDPAEVEAGRTLAEVQLHLRRLGDAEATLRKVVARAPGDVDAYLALERVLVQENKLPEAIALLEKLVTVDPKSARQLYQRMSQYAHDLYRDDDAIKYAARAVELNPDDAEGHRRLGEMYRRKQDTERAIAEFRAAISKNDRLFVVYMELADLLLARGESEEADRLFRRVIRGAPDEELVARAARLSMQINLGNGTLESLERELLPLAIGNPQKKVYRRVLIEIYGSLTFALVQRERHGSGGEAEAARKELERVGARAVKPLLDALADGDAGQQRIAIDVLGYVRNRNASAALFAFASGQAETALRTRAMLACGSLRDPALLPRYEAFLFPKSGGGGEPMASDVVARAATWAVAKLQDKRAVGLLRRVAQRGTPDMRAFAALGLGALDDRASVPLLAELARSLGAGTPARAAAAYALGELRAESEAPTLIAIAEGRDSLPRQMAVLALARMGAAKGAPPGGASAIAAIADAVFAAEGDGARAQRASGSLRRAAAAALVLLATQRAPGTDPLSEPNDDVDAEAALEALVPRGLTPKERAAALVVFGDALERAARGALATSAPRARVVLGAMGSHDGTFEPFVAAGADGAESAAARAKATEITAALEPSVVGLARHPDPGVRMKAIAILARSRSDAAGEAIAEALTDASEAVLRVALASVGRHASRASVAAVGGIARTHESWAIRVLAVEALGRLGRAGAGAEAARTLEEAARNEPYALVREAALLALATYDAPAAARLAAHMAAHDPEPRVRATATKIGAAR